MKSGTSYDKYPRSSKSQYMRKSTYSGWGRSWRQTQGIRTNSNFTRDNKMYKSTDQIQSAKHMGNIYKKVYGNKGITTDLRQLKGVLKYNSKLELRRALFQKRQQKKMALAQVYVINFNNFHQKKKQRMKAKNKTEGKSSKKELPKLGVKGEGKGKMYNKVQKQVTKTQEKSLHSKPAHKTKEKTRCKTSDKDVRKTLCSKFANKYKNQDAYFQVLMERSLGVEHDMPVSDTSPWSTCELKFRDGMQTHYDTVHCGKRGPPAMQMHKANITQRFNSPMFCKSEYNSKFQKYAIKESINGKDWNPQKQPYKCLVDLPHVDRTHYNRTFLPFGKGKAFQYKHPYQITVMPHLKVENKSSYRREYNDTIQRHMKDPDPDTGALLNESDLVQHSFHVKNNQQIRTQGLQAPQDSEVEKTQEDLKQNAQFYQDTFNFKGQYLSLNKYSFKGDKTETRKPVEQRKSRQNKTHNQANLVNHNAPF